MGSGLLAFAPYDHLPRLRELPRDPEQPLAVHRLSTVHRFYEFAALWAADAWLVPTGSRLKSGRARAAWDKAVPTAPTTSMLLERDEAAGDDQYLFFSLNALHRDSQQVYPAVAYRLDRLCAPVGRSRREPRVGFRPHDLEPAYRVVDQAADDWSNTGSDCGCDPGEACRCTQFTNLSEALSRIADFGTITGSRAVMDLAQAHLRALRGEDMTEVARPHFQKVVNEANWCATATDDYLYDPDDILVCKGVRKIHWADAFQGLPSAGTVEILYGGALRLKDADYVCTDDGWRQLR